MSSPANISNLSNAIKRGALKGQLTLPSGIAGRVKAGTKVGEVAISVFGTFIDLNLAEACSCSQEVRNWQGECGP